MSSIDIFKQIEENWSVFHTNHIRFNEKQVKAAGVRARKAIGEIKKLASQYRTACLTESKEL
jgi:hypothetical protein|tara:strand:+ start:170 stop:355 length:186 start_codon:yes stop_codon:yes gene_type:complete